MRRVVSTIALAVLGHPALAAEVAPRDEIIVSAPFQRQQFDVLQATSILADERLDQALETSIGETLEGLPGVSSSYFGPGASRPIVRGQSGERVRIMIDGIGSIDASNTSPDHAVAGEPITAERIEVLRGPASLLYGSSAAGGVVNIIDGRIPAALPEGGVAGRGFGRYGENGDEASLAASVSVAATEHLALHADGFWRDSSDSKTPLGLAINTDAKAYGAAAGASAVFDRGFFGVAVANLQSEYGSPAEDEVRIDLDQTRVDAKGQLDLDGWFQEAKFRFGYGDYQHRELEGEEVGTIFLNQGWETRLELVERPHGAHKSAVGVQLSHRDFKAIGDEAFVPPNDTLSLGLFTLQERKFGHWTFEASGRYEHVDVENSALGLDRAITPVSVSLGVSHLWNDRVRAGLNLYRTERAPAAEELFSNGPHLATATFERGDQGLREEVARGGEATLRVEGEHGMVNAALFYTRYDDFIFERASGEVVDDLPVIQFSSTDTRFLGAEVEVEAHLHDGPVWQVNFDAVAELVRATDTSNHQPLPRIPPKSATIGLAADSDGWGGRVEVEAAAKAARLGPLETPTSGYGVVNADLVWRPWGTERNVALMLQGRNLNDAVVRRHASFLKDILPLPGRSIRLALRAGF